MRMRSTRLTAVDELQALEEHPGRAASLAPLQPAPPHRGDNRCGRALYERNGYELVGRVENFPSGTDVLWYRKRLQPTPAPAEPAPD